MKPKLLVLAALMVLIMPHQAHAAVDRVIVQGLGTTNSPTHLAVTARYMDGLTMVDIKNNLFPLTSITDEQSIIGNANSAILLYAAGAGYTNIDDPSDITWTFLSTDQIEARIASSTAALATVATTGDYYSLSNLPASTTAPLAMSFATTSRSLNSAFQVSSTRAAFVSYTVDVATTLSLTGGQTGTVTLQYADDSGFTTNVKTIQSSVNGNTGALSIGLNLTQTSTAAVTGMVPAGKYVRIVTANTAGTPTFTFRAAQEVLLPSN